LTIDHSDQFVGTDHVTSTQILQSILTGDYLQGTHRQDLSAFPKGARNDHHNLSCGRDSSRRPSARNPRASTLDHSVNEPLKTAKIDLEAHDYVQSWPLVSEKKSNLSMLN